MIKKIKRKSLLYKTGVEYGDYTINHIEGCAHGCMYPCYAMMMAKRFGKVSNYNDWIKPKIVSNYMALLEKEIPRYKKKIKFVHLCFSSDPFMYQYDEIAEMSYKIIETLNNNEIRCTALTKGILPSKLSKLSEENEFGITLITLNEKCRKKYEPWAASVDKRIKSLYVLHKKGIKTWISIEPYPTPNIINQDFAQILEAVSFVDKIIFGRLNYNSLVTKYKKHKEYFNELSSQVIEFCKKNKKLYHIKHGTITQNIDYANTKEPIFSGA